MAERKTKKIETKSVGISLRIDPKIKFALDIAGKTQKRSLTAVVEWAVSKALSLEPVDNENNFMGVINDIWTTDASKRFINLCYKLPEALTYEEQRLWETIKASSVFWKDYDKCKFTKDEIILHRLNVEWEPLLEYVELHKNSSTVGAYLSDLDHAYL